jgi:hypothetical protein
MISLGILAPSVRNLLLSDRDKMYSKQRLVTMIPSQVYNALTLLLLHFSAYVRIKTLLRLSCKYTRNDRYLPLQHVAEKCTRTIYNTFQSHGLIRFVIQFLEPETQNQRCSRTAKKCHSQDDTSHTIESGKCQCHVNNRNRGFRTVRSKLDTDKQLQYLSH